MRARKRAKKMRLEPSLHMINFSLKSYQVIFSSSLNSTNVLFNKCTIQQMYNSANVLHNFSLRADYSIEILSMRRWMVPRGILISATSPTFLLSSPLAIGVVMEILPSRRLASLSLTMV